MKTNTATMPARPGPAAATGLLHSLAATLRRARERRLAILELRRMPAPMRADLGLDAAAIERTVHDLLARRDAAEHARRPRRLVRARTGDPVVRAATAAGAFSPV